MGRGLARTAAEWTKLATLRESGMTIDAIAVQEDWSVNSINKAVRRMLDGATDLQDRHNYAGRKRKCVFLLRLLWLGRSRT